MKRLFDQKAEVRQFSSGDQVLVVFPLGSPLQARYHGPVLHQVSDQNYLVMMGCCEVG